MTLHRSFTTRTPRLSFARASLSYAARRSLIAYRAYRSNGIPALTAYARAYGNGDAVFARIDAVLRGVVYGR